MTDFAFCEGSLGVYCYGAAIDGSFRDFVYDRIFMDMRNRTRKEPYSGQPNADECIESQKKKRESSRYGSAEGLPEGGKSEHFSRKHMHIYTKDTIS